MEFSTSSYGTSCAGTCDTQRCPQLSADNISWGTSCLRISQEQLDLSASSASRQQWNERVKTRQHQVQSFSVC